MSRVFMLKPADGIEGVKNAILTAVKDAGPNACPPMVVGVGIGGTFEKCVLMAKEALTREVGSHSEIEWAKEDFPAIVVADCEGNNLYETAIKEYQKI